MLWSLEGPREDVADSIDWLNAKLAVPIDYVVLVAEDTPAQRAIPGYSKLASELESGMKLYAASPGDFVRVYQRALVSPTEP